MAETKEDMVAGKKLLPARVFHEIFPKLVYLAGKAGNWFHKDTFYLHRI